ncbi:hypothetical protein [Chitinophaga sp. CF418]|uniref:hypothetical protein n=1 Tax=Chitinophaga sp. CF418 TaxID=1855287 RepID=UPI0009126803|nr:hypothetical protein [Chitinophaga sp. CF418]SHN13753.1 hypothetical protein SAMN05216311_105413 [Chitinophaga sp. CF418]
MRKVLWMTGYICLCLQYTYAGDIYVAPSGNDLNAGTTAQPKATLAAAMRQAREWRRLNKSCC